MSITRSVRQKTKKCSFRFVTAISASLIAAIVLDGCASSLNSPEPLTDTGPADIHRVQSDRLQEIMRRLNSTFYSRQATALDVDAARLRHAKEIGELLASMSREIVYLAKDESVIGLKEAAKQLFVSYAKELGTRGEEFSLIAETKKTEMFAPAMNRVVKTCNACHNEFRDM